MSTSRSNSRGLLREEPREGQASPIGARDDSTARLSYPLGSRCEQVSRLVRFVRATAYVPASCGDGVTGRPQKSEHVTRQRSARRDYSRPLQPFIGGDNPIRTAVPVGPALRADEGTRRFGQRALPPWLQRTRRWETCLPVACVAPRLPAGETSFGVRAHCAMQPIHTPPPSLAHRGRSIQRDCASKQASFPWRRERGQGTARRCGSAGGRGKVSPWNAFFPDAARRAIGPSWADNVADGPCQRTPQQGLALSFPRILGRVGGCGME